MHWYAAYRQHWENDKYTNSKNPGNQIVPSEGRERIIALQLNIRHLAILRIIWHAKQLREEVISVRDLAMIICTR